MKKYIEALLFASSEPLSQSQVNSIFPNEKVNLKEIVLDLNKDYQESNKLIYIKPIAEGYQIFTKPECHIYIQRMFNKSKRMQLSIAGLEALSIIAYKQPISKSDVEYIRGVNCDSVIKTLLEKDLVTIKGREESPGRALLYGTTQIFLECFGLNKLTDLPKLKEISELINNSSSPTTLFDATE